MYTYTYMILLKGVSVMDIETILPSITHICIYYYKSYYSKILNHDVNIPDKTIPDMMNYIYKWYVSTYDTTDVYDITLIPGNYIYNKQYILEEEHGFDITDAIGYIDNFMDNYDFYSDIIIPINVINISDLPIDNGINITNEWIKRFIDLYRY